MKENNYHKENLKQELIEAGIRIVAEESYDALTLRRLAAECSVSHAAPYKHFHNKEEILSALTEFAHEQLAISFTETLDLFANADALTRVVELGKTYIAFMMEHPYYIKVLFIGDISRTLSGEDPYSAAVQDKPLDIFMRTAVLHLKALGTAAEDYEYDLVAMWSLVHGLTLILANGNWKPKEGWREAADKILRGKLKI